MDRQARTGGDTVLVLSTVEVGRTGRTKDPNTAVVAGGGGRKGKDDRKQNTLTPLHCTISLFSLPSNFLVSLLSKVLT